MFLTPQDYYRTRRLRPRKRFGQHFLAQPGTAERIVEAAELRESDAVVEVGPGLGALTRFILPRVRVLHLVELDRDLAAYLERAATHAEYSVAVHQQDIMELDFDALARSVGRRLVVVGNLPYNISSPLAFRLLDSLAAIDRAVFMVQKEVGERWAAEPGTKDYGPLTVLLGVCGRVTPLFTVGPSQFYPPPKVDSLVLRLDFPAEPVLPKDEFVFLRRLVNTVFQKRRKMLRNSLAPLAGESPCPPSEAFARTGIDPRRRPEELAPGEFVLLARTLMGRDP